LPPETRRPGASWNSPADAQKSPANSAQGGAYHLLTRFPEHDEVERITANSAVHDGSDLGAWRTAWGDPTTSGVTLTVTEKGYHLRGDGGLDRDYPAVAADLAAMARDRLGAGPTTAPGRLAQGVLARAELSPQAAVAVVSCDNLHANGEVARRVVFDVLEAVAPDTIDWAASTVRFVSTMVDRITPATTAKDVDQVRYITGVDDPATVVIEPFSEWVLGGEFPAGRPRWERGGALFSENVSDRERRKLLMLNGAHSLIALVGLLRSDAVVAEVVRDDAAVRLLRDWWRAASALLPFPTAELDSYAAAVLERFSNPRIEHRPAQIAADSSQKLRVHRPGRARRARSIHGGAAGRRDRPRRLGGLLAQSRHPSRRPSGQ